MENVDFNRQIGLIKQFGNLGFWGVVLIVLGTLGVAYYQKRKGGNYKKVIIIGIIIFFIYGLISAITASLLVTPIYNLAN
jgi:hypothetical protein